MNTSYQFKQSVSPRDAQPDPRDVSRQVPATPYSAGVSPAQGPPPRSLRLLYIDDDERVLESLKACLEFFGHQVGAASGGTRGVEMFCIDALKSEPYDVVITDLNMPNMDGYEVARQIKAESPETPVILISGLGPGMNKAAAASAVVDAVINKPPDLRALNELLLRLTRQP
jgi:CheY-like chemotaxis protein